MHTMMDLEGRVALVTGGTRGIGLGIAKALIGRGCKVCISSVKKESGDKALAILSEKYSSDNLSFIQCDVAKKDQLEDLFKRTLEKYNRLDILVNNAGVALEGKWEDMVQINLNAVIRGTYLGLRYMDANKGGKGGVIVNTGSSSSIAIDGYSPVYVATKHAVKGFTESVGLTSMARFGVRVNAICPGWVTTDMYDDLADPSKGQMMCYGPDANKTALESQAKEDSIGADDLAEVVIQLIDDETINGQCMIVIGDKKCLLPPSTNLDHLQFIPIY